MKRCPRRLHPTASLPGKPAVGKGGLPRFCGSTKAPLTSKISDLAGDFMSRRVSRELRAEYKTIATERIERLFELADGVSSKRPELADRYVQLAWRLATRYNIRLPPRLKRKFCRKCMTFLKPGKSCRVRTRTSPPRVIITCLRCGHHIRHCYQEKRTKLK